MSLMICATWILLSIAVVFGCLLADAGAGNCIKIISIIISSIIIIVPRFQDQNLKSIEELVGSCIF